MNNEEQIKVLQMVADGIISVEEGEKLLEVLDIASQSEPANPDAQTDFMSNFENNAKQSKLDKQYEKEYRKHLKRTQKLAKKHNHHQPDNARVGEERLTRAADELAQKAVDKALESIGKKVENITKSIFE